MNGTGSRHFKFYNSHVNISLYMYMKMTIAPLIKTIQNGLLLVSIGFRRRSLHLYVIPFAIGGGRVVQWCWVNFQCQGVLQFGLQ